MKHVVVFAFVFLVAMGGFSYGVAVGLYRIWPYQQIGLVKDEARFILSDLTRGLDRQIVTSATAHSSDGELIDLGSDQGGGSRPTIWQSRPSNGLTAVMGSFDTGEFHHAILLLGPNGELVHRWRVSETSVDAPELRSSLHKYPHGLAILSDGSVLVNFDGGVSLQRLDACGSQIWVTPGKYHHLMSVDEGTESVWTLINKNPVAGAGSDVAQRRGIQKISISDGSIEMEFTMRDIIDANPDLDVLGIRQLEEAHSDYVWDLDPIHDNDVEPLPAAYATRFPMFSPGDLLISLRSLNAVIVVDPASLEIKWFTIGWMRRQHDPDWEPNGTISVFDNNMHRGISRILSFDPSNYGPPSVILDGQEFGFYTWIRGNHQQMADGSILVTSSQEGRIFEVDNDGNVVFEFINAFGDTGNERLTLSNAIRLPIDYFHKGAFDKCGE
ncbi:MAG: arylsulfotransferase family protein [Pseudomonadota bacterium]